MKQFTLLRKLTCVALLALALPLFAAKTSIDGLFRYTLDNGLELFVMENDAAPLAYIEIAVRAGGVTQVPETAGLFHLYEHMMFKGNAKYANQAAVQDAINELGISNWNGTTGVDRVNYYFTVPSALVRDGLEFWSYAIRTPLMDEKELENEKAVVLSEIGADETDPAHIFLASLNTTLFAESPWQLDPSGMPKTVQEATVSQLRAIQAQYYVPNNAALFVGGAVHHDAIYQYVKEIYGDWQRGEKVPAVTPPSKTPFGTLDGGGSHTKLVYPDRRTSGNFVQVGLYLRGPDGETDARYTYAADVWTNLLDNPAGAFKQQLLADKALAIPDADYLGSFYATRRASGILGFSAVMLNTANPVAQAEHFFTALREQSLPTIASNDFLTADALTGAKRQLENARIYSLETARGVLSSLSTLWAACGADYFFSYEKHINAVTADDVQRFLQAFIADACGLQIVFVSPEVYQAHEKAFKDAGYREVSAENSFWWKQTATPQN